MEKVTGIGGLFFRSQNPESLARWYYERLGVTVTPTSYDDLPWQQQAGPTAFAPFPLQTEYFGDASHAWMVNFSCEQSRGHGRAAARRGRRGDDRCGDLSQWPLCAPLRSGGQPHRALGTQWVARAAR